MLQSQLECARCGNVNPCRLLLCFRAKKASSISKCRHCRGVSINDSVSVDLGIDWLWCTCEQRAGGRRTKVCTSENHLRFTEKVRVCQKRSLGQWRPDYEYAACTGVQLMQWQQFWPIQFYPPDISQKMFSYGIMQCSWQHINGEIVQHDVTYSVSCWTQSLSSSTWPPMNQTRFEKYGAAVLSLIYRNMLWSSTATTTRRHVHVSLMCKYILRTSFIEQFLQTEHSQLPTNQLQ